MNQPTDTPIDRLRELHRPCPRPNCSLYSHCDLCGQGAMGWPCDTIAALDALEALLVVSPADLGALDMSTQSIIRHAGDKDAEIRALRARTDAAAKVLTEALRLVDDGPIRSDIRAWLAGDREAHGEL